MYINKLCIFVSCKMSKRVAVFLGDLLFAKALSCAISVLKADPVQVGATMYKGR